MSLTNSGSLVPGVWISFYHDEQPIPSEASGSFQIIRRTDDPFDACRCLLTNSLGQKFDYCPRMCTLDSVTLPFRYHVKVLQSDSIDAFFQKQPSEHLNRSLPR
jgi:hypothetical protein